VSNKRSWRDEAAEHLDDACAVDVSATGIDRSQKPWWNSSPSGNRLWALNISPGESVALQAKRMPG
jgi:hypothetical protein